MKNKILLIVMLLLLPLNVFAKENSILVNCDNLSLENNMEVQCEIVAENFNYSVTSISGQVKLSENLKLIESNYDNKIWKVLDKKFTVRDINLIGEDKYVESNFKIAIFKIKAVNKKDSEGLIQLVNVVVGDDMYESHNITVDEKQLNLRYDKKNEEINTNPTTKGINVSIPIICIILLFGYAVFLTMRKKEN